MARAIRFSLAGRELNLELPPPRVLVFIFGTFLAFLVLETYLFLIFQDQPIGLSPWEIAFWALLIFWSVRVEVRLPLNASMGQLFIIALALIALTSPWLVSLLVFLFQLSGNTWYKQIFNRSQDALATGLAALAWHFFQQNPVWVGGWNLSAGVGILAASTTLFLANITLVSLAIHLATATPLREVWRKNFRWLALSYFLLAPIALLLARAYETPLLANWGGWTVLLFLIPLYYSRLLKPGTLTPEEFALIQSHTTKGAELLSPARKVAFDQLVYNVILHHHERWDGRGYPKRLAGHEIPEEARIVGLADAYEAMTAGRPYRKAKTPEEALREVQELSGHQFDPRLVEAFTELWAQNPIWRDREAYIAAKEGSLLRSTSPQRSSASALPSPSEPGPRTSEE